MRPDTGCEDEGVGPFGLLRKASLLDHEQTVSFQDSKGPTAQTTTRNCSPIFSRTAGYSVGQCAA